MDRVGVEMGDAEMEGKGRKRERVTFFGLSAIPFGIVPWGMFLRHRDGEAGDCDPITAIGVCSMSTPVGAGEDGKGGRKGVEWEKRKRGKLKAISDSEFISPTSID